MKQGMVSTGQEAFRVLKEQSALEQRLEGVVGANHANIWSKDTKGTGQPVQRS